MSLVKLKAKVNLTSEEMMEAEGTHDFGSIAKAHHYEWRMIALPVEEIYKVIAYDKSKTIVILYDEEKILVQFSFKTVCKRYEAAKKESCIERNEEFGEEAGVDKQEDED